MAELQAFSSIDVDDETVPEPTREAAAFFQKMDYEGGLTGLLAYGGPSVFPHELQGFAIEADAAIEELRHQVNAWAAKRGVEY